MRRHAFRGPIALEMSLHTSGKTPSHGHTIAKNLLDLLSRPQPGVRTDRRGLLYYDDSQIHGLSVSCLHGQAKPRIDISAMSLGHFLEDLELAVHAGETLNDEAKMEFRDDSIESFRDTLRNKNGL